MVHPELKRLLKQIGLQEASEVFNIEKPEGNWSYLRLKQPTFSCERIPDTRLLWEIIAFSDAGPVFKLEKITVSIFIRHGKGVNTETSKTWFLDELMQLSEVRPMTPVLLEFLINAAPHLSCRRTQLFQLLEGPT